MELSTVALIREAWYRLVGTTSTDAALTELGEDTDEIAYLALTRGSRAAQRWMLKMGYGGWRKRSAALSFSGSDTTTGGTYAALPTDFLRTVGRNRVSAGYDRQSALREANGNLWGVEIDETQDHYRGDYYYIRGEQLWLARTAQPPSPLYLDYHYTHPTWTSNVTIDFPVDARSLIVAEAANVAMEENWFPLDNDGKQSVARALKNARDEARDLVRQTRTPRRFAKAPRYGANW